MFIPHPEHYKDRTRVLFLKSRHKDGVVTERMIMRVSHGVEHFDKQIDSLFKIMLPNERIYASAGARDVAKAIRIFKEQQLAADYDADTADFYRHIESRWVSCLMNPKAQEEKVWLLDCDSETDATLAYSEYMQNGRATVEPYRYKSKFGEHIVVSPFDRSRVSKPVQAMLHDNAILLWAYS